MMPAFSHPLFLAPAAGFALLALGLGFWAQARPGVGVQVVAQKPWILGLGTALILAGLGLGLAEPRWGLPEHPRLTVHVVVDASRSMNARDAGTNALRGDRLLASLAMSPRAPASHAGNPHSKADTTSEDLRSQAISRWEAAVARLDGLWAEPRPGLRWSLDLLTGDLVPVLPPGEDRTLLRDALRALKPGEIGSPGTSLGRSITQAVAQVEASEPAVILLLGDGEETWEAEPLAAAHALEALKRAKLPLYALVLGKPTPAALPSVEGQPQFTSAAHAKTLERLATGSGGRLMGPTEDLAPLLQSLADGRAPLPVGRSKQPAHPEWGAWLALLGVGLWMSGSGRPMKHWRLPL